MTPTKQTVYFETESSHMEYVDAKEGYFFTPEQLNEYTANVIKQALDTAAKEAEPNILNKRAKNPKFTIVDVDKKSITNTFEQTFQKYKI